MGATPNAVRPDPAYVAYQGYWTVEVPRAADYAQHLYREGHDWAAIIEKLAVHYPGVWWESVQTELGRRARRRGLHVGWLQE